MKRVRASTSASSRAPGTRGSIQIGLTVSVPIAQAVDALNQRGVRFSSAQGTEIVDDGHARDAVLYEGLVDLL